MKWFVKIYLIHSMFSLINYLQIFINPVTVTYSHSYWNCFIGIGGISMSGLAEILLGEDFVISGSDSKSSPLTQALEKKGATIYYGQRATNKKKRNKNCK